MSVEGINMTAKELDRELPQDAERPLWSDVDFSILPASDCTVLSADDVAVFFEMLDNPPEPSPELIRLFESYAPTVRLPR